MSQNSKTILQRLSDVIIGTGAGAGKVSTQNVVNYNIAPSYTTNANNDEILYKFKSKEERDSKLAELRQQKFLSYQWQKVGYDSTMAELAGSTQVRVMYRDAQLMGMWPEIGAALDIYAEESTVLKNGKMLNIYSKSPRIKAILEDLFVNRLDIHATLPMIFRDTCQYGNDFHYLNIDFKNGIIGWRQLPVFEMRRVENGMQYIYGGATSSELYNLKPDEVKFVWEGHNDQTPFKNWQVAHFRLIRNSTYLPYGASILDPARRHWRLLSMMEDALFVYRIERSVERRIFKVNVGALDEKDVPAFLQEFANNFKRAPIVDPKTGQIDLRKNFLDVSADYFIPVRPGQTETTIDTLQSAQNITGMDDIKYMQEKILAALKIPKTFLNFNEAQGKGQNLALMDIRFNRTINYIQQAVLMELTKIAIIHLYLMGFEDDLMNFTLTMNNPSNQIEMMELDNMTKRVTLASSALAEQGCGVPLMSWYRTQKEIMGLTDAEISDMLNQIRLESAISNELQLTNQIIQKTGLFNKTDRIYGEPGAKYNYNAMGDNGGGSSSIGGGVAPVGGGGGFGDDLGDLGEPSADDSGEISGDSGTSDLSGMGGDDNSQPLQERRSRRSPFDIYIEQVLNREEKIEQERPQIIDRGLMINEELMSKLQEIESISEKTDSDALLTETNTLKEIIKEATSKNKRSNKTSKKSKEEVNNKRIKKM